MDNIDWGSYLTSFEGRLNRAKFWLGVAIIYIVEIIALTLFDTTIFAIVLVVLLWPWLAISIKRWHDRGKSGWWMLIVFVPLIGSLWFLIECGFLPGDDGSNEYGPDPLAA